MHRDPPPGFNRISVSQLIEADRKVFSRLIELDVKPRKASDGTFPMDDALMQALESYEVSFSLMHLQSRAAPPPNRPNKRQREEDTRKGKGKSKSRVKARTRARLLGWPFPKSFVTKVAWHSCRVVKPYASTSTFMVTGPNARPRPVLGSICVPNALGSTL